MKKIRIASEIDDYQAKQRIRELHDKYHPEAIFMTQTGATLFGWALKEIYRTAWPNEKIPKIFTIDTHPLRFKGDRDRDSTEYSEALIVDENSAEFQELKKEIGVKLKSHKIRGNVAIIDENQGFETGDSIGMSLFHRYPVFEPDAKTNDPRHEGFYKRGSKTLGYGYLVTKNAMKDLGMDSKAVVMGLGGSEREIFGPWTREEYDKESEKQDLGKKAYIVRTPEQRSLAKERISELKEWGRQIGEEIKQDEASGKSLEKRILFFISIGAFLISFLFLSSNFTGNIIGNLGGVTSNFIGIGLFILGIVLILVYVKIKRKR